MNDTKNLFLHGDKNYTPAVMWFTSGEIDKNEMTYQLEGFADKGIRDFFIHPANGTEGDYLGEKFFDMIKHAVSEAKRLGMSFWMYDEYNWPSGIAGGQVLRDAPWARSSRLVKMTRTVGAGETVIFNLPSRERYNTELQHCFVDGESVEVALDGEALVWTNSADTEKLLEIYVSKWIMGKTPVSMGSAVTEDVEGVLDTLDADAVRVFIEKTHEVYKQHIGEHFGECVKGIFSDEVTAYYELRDGDEIGLATLPWTRRFPDKFAERCGYDIREHLSELMRGTDVKLSIDYWDTVCELFTDGFARLVGEWCEKNGIIYTGHIDAEESLYYAVYGSGDPYEYYKHFTYPGIDTIFSYYRINDYSFNIAPKLAASAAHFLGKERVLSETYTVSGWDIRLSDMKRIFNRLALHGISFVQFMGARYRFMPGLDSSAMTNNWQNPLFKHYGELTKYISGIQSLVANTVCDASTLVFYPLTTVKANLKSLPVDIYGTDMNYTFAGAVNSLINLNVPFEIGFEQVIDSAEVSGGRINIAGSSYHTVILPCTELLREKTYKKLVDFANGGGLIVSLNGSSVKVLGDSLYEAESFAGSVSYDCHNYEMCGEHATSFDSFQRAPMGEFTKRLADAISDRPASVVKIDARDGIMSSVRRSGDAYYVIIMNDNAEPTEVSGEVTCGKPFAAFNTESGDSFALECDGISFKAVLSPYECVVIEISDGVKPAVCEREVRNYRECELYGVKFETADKNIGLPEVYHVRGEAMEKILRASGDGKAELVCDIAKKISDSDAVLCRGYAIGDLPVKAKHDWFGWFPVDKKTIGAGESVVAVYDFTLDHLPSELEMIADPAFDTVWYLNGERLAPSSERRVWYKENEVYDISGVVSVGKNRMVSVSVTPVHDRAYPVPCAMLRGDFRVFLDFVLTDRVGENRLDFWNTQGYACYAGDGIYTAKFTAKDTRSAYISLETSDTVEIFVNGQRAAKRLWSPYEADITPYITDGENLLELRVSSTYSNFIYNSNPSGIKSAKIFTLK